MKNRLRIDRDEVCPAIFDEASGHSQNDSRNAGLAVEKVLAIF